MTNCDDYCLSGRRRRGQEEEEERNMKKRENMMKKNLRNCDDCLHVEEGRTKVEGRGGKIIQ